MIPTLTLLLLLLQAWLTYELARTAFTKQPRRWVAWLLLAHWLPLAGAVDYVGWQAWHEKAPAEVARGSEATVAGLGHTREWQPRQKR